MYKNNYAKSFVNRTAICFVLVIALFLVTILRIAVIISSDYSAVAYNQSIYRIEISKIRGTIYDCNMTPITNTANKNIAIITPTPQNIIKINSLLSGDELKNALEKLENNMPVVCEIKGDTDNAFLTTMIYEHTNNNLPACHVIGYTDASGHGVTGLEKAYDDLLYSGESVSAVFTKDGKGNVLEGIKPYFVNDVSLARDGVITTLDMQIQLVTEAALSKFSSGCAIVADVKTGEIKAMASVPSFDVTNIAQGLNGKDSPMLNRCLSSYNVGSVFKPLISAVAIESGNENHSVTCLGSTKIIDRTFRCHKLDGHGNVDMNTALSQSCNCYFYDLAILLKGEKIYNMASALSINSKIRIADNIYTSYGNMPTSNEMSNDATLANIGIGQGSIIASPVTMLNLYMAIAGDGSYYLPSIVKGIYKDGEITPYNAGNKTRVMSADTAQKIRKYLKNVILDGTGTEAFPSYCTAAGKTATAQTGRYNSDGTEITNSWFCGFFPSNTPEYVVVVMSENKQSVSTAAVFAKIADGIMEYNVKNSENAD